MKIKTYGTKLNRMLIFCVYIHSNNVELWTVQIQLNLGVIKLLFFLFSLKDNICKISYILSYFRYFDKMN